MFCISEFPCASSGSFCPMLSLVHFLINGLLEWKRKSKITNSLPDLELSLSAKCILSSHPKTDEPHLTITIWPASIPPRSVTAHLESWITLLLGITAPPHGRHVPLASAVLWFAILWQKFLELSRSSQHVASPSPFQIRWRRHPCSQQRLGLGSGSPSQTSPLCHYPHSWSTWTISPSLLDLLIRRDFLSEVLVN